MQTLNDKDKEKYKTSMGLFEVLNENLSHSTMTILSLQYCKLISKHNENTEEWMGHLRIKSTECEYKRKDKILKEQFIININNDDMMKETR